MRLGTSLDHVFEEEGEDRFAFVIMPRGFRVYYDELDSLIAPEMLDAIAMTFEAVGIDDRQGMALAYLFGESDPMRKLYRFGVRGVASSGIAKLIEKLGAFPRFKDSDHCEDADEFFDDPIGNRVFVRQLTEPTQRVGDLMRIYWDQCPTILPASGGCHRVEDRRLLPEQLSSQVALWLDQWTIADMSLMIGLCDDGEALSRCHCFHDY